MEAAVVGAVVMEVVVMEVVVMAVVVPMAAEVVVEEGESNLELEITETIIMEGGEMHEAETVMAASGVVRL